VDNVYSLEVATEPAAEPLTLAEAKEHLRVDLALEDELIEALIVAAREWTENYCRRSWIVRTLKLHLDYFDAEILLPRGPVVSVASVEYMNGAALVALDPSAYVVDRFSLPARIRPVFGGTWPSVASVSLNGVVVTYDAGYPGSTGAPPDLAANVPQAVKAAMKLLIGGWFENREHIAEKAPAEVPLAVKSLLSALEVRDFRLE